MSLVRFDSSIVTVKQSFIVNKIVGCPCHYDFTSLHSQWHRGLTNRRPTTSRLNWPIRSKPEFLIPLTDVIQLTLTLKMTTAQVVETSVTVNNSSIQNYVHSDDYAEPTYFRDCFYRDRRKNEPILSSPTHPQLTCTDPTYNCNCGSLLVSKVVSTLHTVFVNSPETYL